MIKLPMKLWICRHSKTHASLEWLAVHGSECIFQEGAPEKPKCGRDNKPCDSRKAVIEWVKEEL